MISDIKKLQQVYEEFSSWKEKRKHRLHKFSIRIADIICQNNTMINLFGINLYNMNYLDEIKKNNLMLNYHEAIEHNIPSIKRNHFKFLKNKIRRILKNTKFYQSRQKKINNFPCDILIKFHHKNACKFDIYSVLNNQENYDLNKILKEYTNEYVYKAANEAIYLGILECSFYALKELGIYTRENQEEIFKFAKEKILEFKINCLNF